MAVAAIALAVPLLTAPSASAAVERGYDCQVGQVSLSLLAAQFCAPRGGAPGDGLITDTFTVSVAVLDGTPGTVRCVAPIGLVPLSGLASASATSVQVLGLNCVRTS